MKELISSSIPLYTSRWYFAPIKWQWSLFIKKNLPHKHTEAFWMTHKPKDFHYFCRDAQEEPTHEREKKKKNLNMVNKLFFSYSCHGWNVRIVLVLFWYCNLVPEHFNQFLIYCNPKSKPFHPYSKSNFSLTILEHNWKDHLIGKGCM